MPDNTYKIDAMCALELFHRLSKDEKRGIINLIKDLESEQGASAERQVQAYGTER